MTDMFIPKKEKIIITIEAIIYVLLIILASYFTICGDLFIRMVPMLYFLGIFGTILFYKPVVTVILSSVSVIVFGYLIENQLNSSLILFGVYSAFMVVFGEATGHILELLYQNYKLRKFIKHYHKIVYIIVLIASIFIPLILNNVVNSNMISYLIAKKDVDKYVNENYAYSSYYIKNTNYAPSYKGGTYKFDTVIDGIDVKLNYTSKEKVADVNMNTRKEVLNRIANAGINILLKENNLTNLDVECRYDYSKIATIPDIIRMNIYGVKLSEAQDVVLFIQYLKEWENYGLIDRIDIEIDNVNVTITKEALNKGKINLQYILNGMKYEVLDNKEGM